jgi:hypothetical protein
MASNPPPIKFMRSKWNHFEDAQIYSCITRLNTGLVAGDKDSTEMKNGDTERWCNWRIEFDDIIWLTPVATADQKINAAHTLFKGKALQHFKEFSWDLLMLLRLSKSRKTRLLGLPIKNSMKLWIRLWRSSSQSSMQLEEAKLLSQIPPPAPI